MVARLTGALGGIMKWGEASRLLRAMSDEAGVGQSPKLAVHSTAAPSSSSGAGPSKSTPSTKVGSHSLKGSIALPVIGDEVRLMRIAELGWDSNHGNGGKQGKKGGIVTGKCKASGLRVPTEQEKIHLDALESRLANHPQWEELVSRHSELGCLKDPKGSDSNNAAKKLVQEWVKNQLRGAWEARNAGEEWVGCRCAVAACSKA